MKCSICNGEIQPVRTPDGKATWAGGNSANPVNDGRCCDTCNAMVVIPARFAQIRETREGTPERHTSQHTVTFTDDQWRDIRYACATALRGAETDSDFLDTMQCVVDMVQAWDRQENADAKRIQ